MNKQFVKILGAIYGVPNLMAFLIAYQTSLFSVDMVPFELKMGEVGMLAIVILFFIFFGFLCALITKGATLLKDRAEVRSSPLLGLVVFVLQFFVFAVAFITGFGKVGGGYAEQSPLAVMASYLGADSFFIFYFCQRRPSGLPVWNLMLYLGSNIYRGWSSIWLVLILLESYFFIQNAGGKVPKLKLTLMVALVATLLPFANIVKDAARVGDVSLEESLNNVDYARNYLRLLDRLQIAGVTLLLAQESGYISQKISNGSVEPWFYINRITSSFIPLMRDAVPLQKFLSASYLISEDTLGKDVVVDDVAWYAHTGLLGWFFLISWCEGVAFFIFIILAILAPYVLVAKIFNDKTLAPALHISIFVYFFHGWFSVYYGFLASLVAYVVMCKFLWQERMR